MSTLSLWMRRDPFADFDGTLNAIIRRTFGPTAYPATRPAGFVPAADLGRDGDDAVIRLELPGLDAGKDVSVEIDRGRLVVKGERRSERSAEKDGHTLRELLDASRAEGRPIGPERAHNLLGHAAGALDRWVGVAPERSPHSPPRWVRRAGGRRVVRGIGTRPQA